MCIKSYNIWGGGSGPSIPLVIRYLFTYLILAVYLVLLVRYFKSQVFESMDTCCLFSEYLLALVSILWAGVGRIVPHGPLTLTITYKHIGHYLLNTWINLLDTLNS